MPTVIGGRAQGERLEALLQRVQVSHIDGRFTDQRRQFAQGRILFVPGLDLLGSGQLITRLGLEDIGTRALAPLEQVAILLELLVEGLLLGQGNVDLVLGEQGLGVVVQDPEQQFLALAAKVFVGEQRLGYALAIAGIGLVVEQRLLQGQ